MPQNFTRKSFLFAETVKNAPKLYQKTRQEDRNAPKTATHKKFRLRRCPWCMTAQIRGHKSKKSARDHIVTPRKHTQIDATTACHIMNVFFLCPKYPNVTREQVEKFYFFLQFMYLQVQNPEIDTRSFLLWKVAHTRF